MIYNLQDMFTFLQLRLDFTTTLSTNNFHIQIRYSKSTGRGGLVGVVLERVYSWEGDESAEQRTKS